MKKTQLFFTAFLSVSIWSHFLSAQTATPACAVPVCDIPAKILELKNASQGARFEYLSNLFASTKLIDDSASLNNLREFGLAAYTLTKQIDTEEWMFTSASQISNRSTEKLITQRPIKSSLLIKYYQSFIGDSQPASFSTLTYWNTELLANRIETQNELSELIDFVKAARDLSDQANHEIYVHNLATDIISTASNKFLQIDPYIEGVYNIKSECINASENQCHTFDKVTIMMGDDLNGILVRFTNKNSPAESNSNFQFTRSEFIEGKTLRSTLDFRNNQNAHFELTIDTKTKTISGTFINSDFVSEVRFTGKIQFSTRPLYNEKSTVQILKKQLAHSFKGHFKLASDPNYKVTAVIQLINDKIVATIQSENLKIHFESCEFLSSKNVITLFSTSNGKFIKLTLKASLDKNNSLILTGQGFSFMNSTNYGVELTQLN